MRGTPHPAWPGLIVVAAVALTVAACNPSGVDPRVENRTLTVTGVTETSFTVSWFTATNDPRFFTDFVYELYVAGVPIVSPGHTVGLDPVVSLTARREETLGHTATGLSAGSGYSVAVLVYDPRNFATAALYTPVVVPTLGSVPLTGSLPGAGNYQHHDLNVTALGTVYDYTLDLDAGPVDLYLVATNPTTQATVPAQVALGSSREFAVVELHEPAPAPAGSSVAASIIRGRPEADLYGAMHPADAPTLRTAPRALSAPYPNSDPKTDKDPTMEGGPSTGIFLDANPYTGQRVEIQSTAQLVREGAAGFGLSIWVEDAVYQPAGGTARVGDVEITALADAFLSDSMIYDRVTALFGKEWGSHSYSNLIPANHNHVTILVYDFDRGTDSNPFGVVGYFWAKDNYRRGSTWPYSLSNERVMFYIDSDTLAHGEEGRDVQIATLAHEFQHMISFYQRTIRRNVQTPLWINEMTSLLTEDLMAIELGVDGPRGVVEGSAGGTGNTAGRLPQYNAANDRSLTNWGSTGDVLDSYSLAYAFGAWLARNYGGTTPGANGGGAVARRLVQNNSSTETGILQAATGESFGTLLWKWGVAALLSDTVTPPPVRYNDGAWITSVYGEFTYSLGSINLYYYHDTGPGRTGQVGPLIYTPDSPASTPMPRGSKMLYRIAESAPAGTFEFSVLVPRGSSLTLVAK